MTTRRIKDLPAVSAPSAGDKLVLDGATTRAIVIETFLALVGYRATSTTSNAIASSGSKTFTVQTGLSYTAGARVRASDAAAPATNWMEGVVTSYDAITGQLIFTADRSAGSGTLTNWTINLAGQPGVDGAGTGDVVGPSSSVDGEMALYNSTTGKLIKRAAMTGLLKAASGVPAAAVAGTDYCAPTTGSTVLKGSSGNTAAATAGTDFVKPDTASAFSKHQYYTLATITDGANLSWDVSSGQKAKVTLGGNRTMNAVSNAQEGATYFLWVIQDATGSRTISWTTTGAGSFDFGTAGAPTLTTTASKADLLSFEAITIGGTLKLRYTGIARGFA